MRRMDREILVLKLSLTTAVGDNDKGAVLPFPRDGPVHPHQDRADRSRVSFLSTSQYWPYTRFWARNAAASPIELAR